MKATISRGETHSDLARVNVTHQRQHRRHPSRVFGQFAREAAHLFKLATGTDAPLQIVVESDPQTSRISR